MLLTVGERSLLNAVCSKCQAHLESPWSFCPRCGAASPHTTEQAKPREHEKAPVEAAFGGIYFGLVAAPVLIIVGGMLCLTGLGAFAGVPMIIAGFLAPLAGPIFGSEMHKGKCPWCGTHVSCVPSTHSFSCHSCGGQIVQSRHELVKAK